MSGSARRGALLLLVATASLSGCAAPQDNPAQAGWTSRIWVDYALVDAFAPRDNVLVSNSPRGRWP